MVVEEKKLKDITVVGNMTTQQMTMTADMSWIMTMLSNLYSDYWAIIPQEILK